MKRAITMVLAALISIFLIDATTVKAGEQPDKGIVIIHTNDVHCGVEPDDTASSFGIAEVAAFRASLEAQGYTTILVDAGDFIQGDVIGTLSNGEFPAKIMNEMHYDVAIPGNHEYDFGMQQFLKLANASSVKYISGNFMNQLTNERVLDSYTIIEKNGVKIGFVGITTPYTISSSSPLSFKDENGNWIYGFCADEDGTLLYSTVQKSIDDAKAAGADIVIAVGHCGTWEDDRYDKYSATEIIANISGIDAFIDGHSHDVYSRTVKDKSGNDVILQQTGTKLARIGTIYLDNSADNAVSAKLVERADYSVTTDDTSAEYAEHARIQALIEEINAVNEQAINQVVAHTEYGIYVNDPDTGKRMVRNHETNMGNMVSDAFRWYAGTDIAMANGGGLRANLTKGDITYGDVIAIVPFNNQIDVAAITGQQLLDIIENGVSKYPEEQGGFMHMSGVEYELHSYINSSVKLDVNNQFVSVDGEYRVKNVMVNGEPLVLDKIYTLAAIDYYLEAGGNGLGGILNESQLTNTGVAVDTQTVIQYIQDVMGGNISEKYSNPYGEGRIRIVAEKPQQPAPPTGDSNTIAVYALLLLASMSIIIIEKRNCLNQH